MLVRVWMENEDNRGPDLPYCERNRGEWSGSEMVSGDETADRRG